MPRASKLQATLVCSWYSISALQCTEYPEPPFLILSFAWHCSCLWVCLSVSLGASMISPAACSLCGCSPNSKSPELVHSLLLSRQGQFWHLSADASQISISAQPCYLQSDFKLFLGSISRESQLKTLQAEFIPHLASQRGFLSSVIPSVNDIEDHPAALKTG